LHNIYLIIILKIVSIERFGGFAKMGLQAYGLILLFSEKNSLSFLISVVIFGKRYIQIGMGLMKKGIFE